MASLRLNSAGKYIEQLDIPLENLWVCLDHSAISKQLLVSQQQLFESWQRWRSGMFDWPVPLLIDARSATPDSLNLSV